METGDGAADVFCCVGCGARLTRPVVQLPSVPEPRPQVVYGDPVPATVPAGSWAFDVLPPAWRKRRDAAPAPAPEERPGDPARWLPSGLWNCPVLHLEDVPCLPRHPDPVRSSGCCGRDGMNGPNLVCARCSRAVATVSDDCWTAFEVRLVPDAVVATRAGA